MTGRSKYAVHIKRSAEKDMDALSASLFDRIAEAVLRLETDPRPNGSRKLRGTDGYRIRVGTYRVLYTVNDDTRIVEVIAVGHRRDVYR